MFVANPDKPRPIQEILLRNKDKLVDFLTKFHTERSDDEQFNDEKAYLIKQIKDMKPLEESKVTEEHWWRMVHRCHRRRILLGLGILS